MPGQVTLRGGIVDVYSPEMDAPVRIDFFGDEIESIRKFDPETQRSSAQLNDALLLPLTETPVTEKLLSAINARLTRAGSAGAALEGGEEPAELLTHVARQRRPSSPAGSSSPPWPEPTAPSSISSPPPAPPRASSSKSPPWCANQGERWWNKIEQRHERSGIGNLVRPEDIYLSPWDLDDRMRKYSGCELDQLGLVDILDADRSDLSEVDFSHPPHPALPRLHPRHHRRHQRAHEAGRPHPPHRPQSRRSRTPRRPVAGVPPPLPPRLPHRRPGLLHRLLRVQLSRRRLPHPRHRQDHHRRTASRSSTSPAPPPARSSSSAHNDLTDDADVSARPTRRKSKTSAFISDFRDLAVGDYVVHVEHGIAQYCGLRVIEENGQPRRSSL